MSLTIKNNVGGSIRFQILDGATVSAEHDVAELSFPHGWDASQPDGCRYARDGVEQCESIIGPAPLEGIVTDSVVGEQGMVDPQEPPFVGLSVDGVEVTE